MARKKKEVTTQEITEEVTTQEAGVKAYPTPVSQPGFEDGSTDRVGTDTSGTTYEATVVAANAGTVAEAAQSAYFDEQALDPYERANAS